MGALNKVAAVTVIGALALSFAACERTVTHVDQEVSPQSCFECHSDQNTFLVAAEQQWLNSFHASGLNIDRGNSASCAGCHISEGFIQRVNGEQVTGEPNPTVIHCFTCHQPHTSGTFDLRWTDDAELLNGVTFDLGAGNLCVACHHARQNVDTYVGTDGSTVVNINNTRWGPHHGVQGDMLIGSNGYEYAAYTYERSTHREATEDGCLDCHFKSTSNNLVGGHSFNMRGDARDEGGDFSELLNTGACEPCHGELDDFNYENAQDDANLLAEELASLLEGAGLLSNGLPVAGPTTADSAGAVWNYLLFEEDRSQSIHNPKYVMGLLESSIQFLEGTLPAAASDPPKQDLRVGATR